MDGDISSGLLNSPNAVVFYNSTTFPNKEGQTYNPYFFKNNTIDCIFANSLNYTACLDQIATMNNQTDIDPSKVKLIKNQNKNIINYNSQVR
jgi:hypothetical protein